MAVSYSKKRLCEIVGGHSIAAESDIPDEKLTFIGAEFDSRQISGGELFVALPGEKTHGHDFVAQAFERGAALALVEEGHSFAGATFAARLVEVPDSLVAFSALARTWRSELQTPVIAVTGSVGKTTVKELTAHILLEKGPGAYSLKSYNNHVGVPYTLCRIKRDHRWAVIEMGMNHAGEIAALTRICRPDVAAITIIAPAHIENFGSIEGIAAAKFEIESGLSPSGPLVVRGDDPATLAHLKRHPVKRPLFFFGEGQDCHCAVSNLRGLGLSGIEFALSLRVDGTTEAVNLQLPLLGIQNAHNIACACLSAKLIFPDLALSTMALRLKKFAAPLMRMNLTRRGEGTWLIDDCYNANPASMGAFLKLAADLSLAGSSVALVVGEMLELGGDADQYHTEAGVLVARASPRFVVAVGPHADDFLAEAKRRGIPHANAADAETAAAKVQQFENEGLSAQVLMIKASRGTGLDRTVKKLMSRPEGK